MVANSLFLFINIYNIEPLLVQVWSGAIPACTPPCWCARVGDESVGLMFNTGFQGMACMHICIEIEHIIFRDVKSLNAASDQKYKIYLMYNNNTNQNYQKSLNFSRLEEPIWPWPNSNIISLTSLKKLSCTLYSLRNVKRAVPLSRLKNLYYSLFYCFTVF
jgi:hypothetical protein